MNYEAVLAKLIEFRDRKQWQEYHTLISLSRALSIESSEVEKVFLWKRNDKDLDSSDIVNLKMEVADVLTYAYYLCEKLGENPNDLVNEKLEINQTRHWKFDHKE